MTEVITITRYCPICKHTTSHWMLKEDPQDSDFICKRCANRKYGQIGIIPLRERIKYLKKLTQTPEVIRELWIVEHFLSEKR